MREYLKRVFGLKEDQAPNEEIRERIAAGAQVTGTNMYILICAILIASIGLNMDSTAVVIGAMLISPLMGVIISMAYGIANSDLNWIRSSGTKFLFQIAVSVITSTAYFTLSPIHSFSGELIARTQPTLWDVLIALFGGFAAIIANTRKSMVSNVIPGTAIATALMPPLCTFGYCLSAGKWMSAVGAGYLFLINTIFICLASVIGLRLMRATSQKTLFRTRKDYIIIISFIIICIVPSVVLAWRSVSGVMMEEKFNTFIENEFQFEETHVVKADLHSREKTIEVMLVGSILKEDQIQAIESDLKDYQLEDYQLDVIQAHMEQGVSKEEFQQFLALGKTEGANSASPEELQELKNLLKIQMNEKEAQSNMIEELKLLYPVIHAAGFTELHTGAEKPEFALVIMVEQLLDDVTEENVGKCLELKFNRPVKIIQIERPAEGLPEAESPET